MTSPDTLKVVLSILRTALTCPHRCVRAIGDQQPRVTLLLLERLHNNTRERCDPTSTKRKSSSCSKPLVPNRFGTHSIVGKIAIELVTQRLQVLLPVIVTQAFHRIDVRGAGSRHAAGSTQS
jgi:hypothetical protein